MDPKHPHSCIMAVTSSLESKALSAGVCSPSKIDDVGFVFFCFVTNPRDAVPNLKTLDPINGILCCAAQQDLPGRWVRRRRSAIRQCLVAPRELLEQSAATGGGLGYQYTMNNFICLSFPFIARIYLPISVKFTSRTRSSLPPPGLWAHTGIPKPTPTLRTYHKSSWCRCGPRPTTGGFEATWLVRRLSHRTGGRAGRVRVVCRRPPHPPFPLT